MLLTTVLELWEFRSGHEAFSANPFCRNVGPSRAGSRATVSALRDEAFRLGLPQIAHFPRATRPEARVIGTHNALSLPNQLPKAKRTRRMPQSPNPLGWLIFRLVVTRWPPSFGGERRAFKPPKQLYRFPSSAEPANFGIAHCWRGPQPISGRQSRAWS